MVDDPKLSAVAEAEEDIVIEIDDDGSNADDADGAASEPAAQPEEAHDDDDDDEERPEGETLEEKRERRRLERQKRKKMQKEREEAQQREIASLKRTLADQQRRLEHVDQRAATQDLSQIDAALNSAARAAQEAEAELAEAVAAGDGKRVVENQRKWYQAAQAINQLSDIKRRAQVAPPKGVDPVLQANYQAWQAKNAWYDSTVKGVDSKIAFAVDQALAEEGWDPRRPEYWDELDKRLSERLPHRYKRQDADEDDSPRQKPRPKPPTGPTGKDSAATLKPNQIRISPERVAAMKEAGVWDDPELRKKYVKRYVEYDRQHKGE
jgi:hypothetical protein